MKLYNIKNMNSLFKAFDQCSSTVRIGTPDGRIYHWKDNRDVLMSILGAMDEASAPSLQVRCEKSSDTNRIMDCMMGYARQTVA